MCLCDAVILQHRKQLGARSELLEPVQSLHIVCLALQKQSLQSTKHGTKPGCLPGKHWQHGRCCLCKATLRARLPMTTLLVAPLAKTGSPGYGVRRNPGHLLHLRTHAKTLSRLLKFLRLWRILCVLCLSSALLLRFLRSSDIATIRRCNLSKPVPVQQTCTRSSLRRFCMLCVFAE